MVALAPLGRLVAPEVTAHCVAQSQRLLMASGGRDPHAVVVAADALVASLGELAGHLGGYGQGGQYQ
jgi:hypothetical protein